MLALVQEVIKRNCPCSATQNSATDFTQPDARSAGCFPGTIFRQIQKLL
jgi:hypothetical protein